VGGAATCCNRGHTPVGLLLQGGRHQWRGWAAAGGLAAGAAHLRRQRSAGRVVSGRRRGAAEHQPAAAGTTAPGAGKTALPSSPLNSCPPPTPSTPLGATMAACWAAPGPRPQAPGPRPKTHREGRLPDAPGHQVRLALAADAQLLHLLAVQLHQPGIQRLLGSCCRFAPLAPRRQAHVHAPVLLGLELLHLGCSSAAAVQCRGTPPQRKSAHRPGAG
jgi:hypothetical protein